MAPISFFFQIKHSIPYVLNGTVFKGAFSGLIMERER